MVLISCVSVSLLSLAVFMIILTFILIFAGYDAIPIYFDDVPLDIQDNKLLQRGMAWEFRNDDTKLVYEVSSGTIHCIQCRVRPIYVMPNAVAKLRSLYVVLHAKTLHCTLFGVDKGISNLA